MFKTVQSAPGLKGQNNYDRTSNKDNDSIHVGYDYIRESLGHSYDDLISHNDDSLLTHMFITVLWLAGSTFTDSILSSSPCRLV